MSEDDGVDGCGLMIGIVILSALAFGVLVGAAYTLRFCYEILIGLH